VDWLQIAADASAFFLGGLSAALAGIVAQIAIQKSRDRSLRRALSAEIRENMRRLGGPVVNAVPGARVIRVTWDSARALDFRPEIFDAIAVGYRYGSQMERWVDILEGRTVKNSWIWWWNWPEDQSRKWLIEKAKNSAQKSYDAFAHAQQLIDGVK
jgi:hypothetical protein